MNTVRPFRRHRLLAGITAVLALSGALVATNAAPSRADDVSAPRVTGSADDSDLGFAGSLSGEPMNGYRLYELPIDNLRNLTAINDEGLVAGWKYTPGEDVPIPFVWGSGIGVQELPHDPAVRWWVNALDGADNAYGRNGRGEVVKWSRNDYGFYEDPQVVLGGGSVGATEVLAANVGGDVLLDGGYVLRGGGLTSLGSLTNALFATYKDIAADGTVYGWSHVDPDGETGPEPGWDEPTAWAPDGTARSLGFPPVPYKGASAVAGNGEGQAVVESAYGEPGKPGYTFTTFLRTASGGYTWLRPADEKLATALVRVRGLADDGTAAGIYRNGDENAAPVQAAIWDDTGRILIMDKLLDDARAKEWHLAEADRISPKGVIAGTGRHSGKDVGWLAVPVDPVVFVHGAGASAINTFEGDTPTDELWMQCGGDRRALSLWPADRGKTAPLFSDASAALQHETCYRADEHVKKALNIYGTLLDRLRGAYKEYDHGTTPQLRQTVDGCDLGQKGQQSPNLFVYAYDWRRDNGDNAKGLAAYVECVKKFWPHRKIDIVAHSMGGLVSRRYVLDTAGEDVDRMITIGSPWLGAPKLVNVLQTGNFAPFPVNGDAQDVKYISGSFPAAHQLAASRLYAEAAQTPIFREDGWDVNGDGRAVQEYSYDDVKSFLDGQNPTFLPGTTGDAFQSEPGQTDWRDDATDVTYTHIAGLQAGAQTIGTTVATQEITCSADTYECERENVMETEMVCGDGTVPVVSALRAGKGVDYNAKDAELLLYQAGSGGESSSVEHTGLTMNRFVDDEILRRLFSISDGRNADGTRIAQDHSWLADPGFEQDSCYRTPVTGGSGGSGGEGLAASSSPYGAADPAPGTSLRYVSVLGATDLVVTDSAGRSSDVRDGAVEEVEGVTQVLTDRADASMTILPDSEELAYTTTFTATGKPLQLELLEGSQQHPTHAVRWTDVATAEGQKGSISTTADGRNVLALDTDGDGTADRTVPPTVDVGGADASDVTAPTVSGRRVDGASGTRYALIGADEGSGVAEIRYSTDGRRFQAYEGPLALDAAVTPVLTVFAVDRVGNRSPAVELRLAELKASLFTSMRTDPAPSRSGWSAGPATVTLTAEAAPDASPVASITYRTTGAGGGREETVPGDSAAFEVSAVGVTTVTYSATAQDGTTEPEHATRVRIDGAAPTARVKVPTDVVTALPAIRGTADDDVSGVTAVELELRDAKGRYWDGSAWTASSAWLTAAGTTRWSRTTGLPSGDALPDGAYRLRVRVTDGAGRSAIGDDVSLTVAPTLDLGVRGLLSPAGDWASATALNDRGQAAGLGRTGQGGTFAPMLWENGAGRALNLSGDATTSEIVAIDDQGTVYGTQSGALGGQAVRWVHGAADPTALPGLGDGGTTTVNDATGDGSFAVGTATAAFGSAAKPVRWTAAGIETLPLPKSATSGTATGVAEDGSASGTVTLPEGTRAVLWPASGGVKLIPTLFNDTITAATAMNDLGVVVGTATTPGDPMNRMFVYEDGKVVYAEAGEIMPKTIVPHAIGDGGTIVGEYTLRTGGTAGPRAFIAEMRTAEGARSWNALELGPRLTGKPAWKESRAVAVNGRGQIAGGQLSGRTYYEGFVATPAHAPIAADVAAATALDTPVRIAFDAFDPDIADALTFEVSAGPAHGQLGAVDAGGATYTPAAGFEGVDRFTYTASDGDHGSVPATVTVTVGRGEQQPPAEPDPVDDAPTVRLTAPETGDEGGTVALHVDLADPEGAPLEAVWAATGGAIRGSGTDVELDLPDGPAEVTVTVSASDGTHVVADQRTIQVLNVAPTAQAGGDRTVTTGVPTAFDGTAADVGPADAASLSAVWDFGDGSTGAGIHQDHAWAAPGSYQVAFTVTDKDGAATTDTIDVTVVDAPVKAAGSAAGAIWVSEGAAVLSVRTDGRSTTGSLVWAGKGGAFTARITGFDRTTSASGKPAAWLEGTAGTHTVKVYVESGLALGRGDIYKMWIDGTLVTASGKRVLGVVSVC